MRNNPLVSLWNAVLFCGGGILLLYHASITYLPDFSLSDLAGLLASVTVIGIFLLTFLASSCLLPAYALSQFDKECSGADPRRVFQGRTDKILLLAFPLSWGIILAGQTFFEQFAQEYRTYFPPVAFLLLAAAAGVTCFIVHSPVAPGHGAINAHTTRWSRWRRRSFGLFLWSMLFLFPLQMGWILAATGEETKVWLGLFLGAFLFLGVNIAAYFSNPRRWWPPLGIGCLIIVILPVVVGRPILWPDLIVQTLSLGNRNAAEIVVSSKQCQSLTKFGARCELDANENGQISLHNVNILSRVGTSVLLELMVEASDTNMFSKTGLPGAPKSGTSLASNEFERFCPGSKIGGAHARCTRCDQLALEKTAGPEHEPATGKQSNAASAQKYKANLICVQMAIPKDQVVSISWSGVRQYTGFTSYSMPDR